MTEADSHGQTSSEPDRAARPEGVPAEGEQPGQQATPVTSQADLAEEIWESEGGWFSRNHD